MKISDKLNKLIAEGNPFFSFEFFPPKTDEGVANLYERQDRLASYGPTFCDITWGAGGSTAGLTLDIATTMQNQICVETMMHLTCTNMEAEMTTDALKKVKEVGIQNILALRGDPPKGQDKFEAVEGGFTCALDLVKFIREQYGDYFGIGVAGYPEAHPDKISDDPEQNEKSYWEDIDYLKQKVDAGADFIITQLFYEQELMVKFVKDCRSKGINVPILPGIMPIGSYGGFKRMTGFCKTRVPEHITAKLEELKDNDEAVKNYGIELGFNMCKYLLDNGIPGLHMYTLNQERASLGILERLGLINKDKLPRTLPWRPAPGQKRASEEVRPIFWSNRPKSYLTRTADWDKFPQGRWGNSSSPAYGTLDDYQFMRRHTRTDALKEKAKQLWGAALESVDDVIKVFVSYCEGTTDKLPWSEMSAMQIETSVIKDNLVELNKKGLLTINSQPAANGLTSESQLGWGGKNGFIYMKPYVEFFVSPQKWAELEPKLKSGETITYMATNKAGDKLASNQSEDEPNAVTWGVFPGKEIIQPTVVDLHSFKVWKDEAFELWMTEWGSLYDAGSTSHTILQDISSNWLLVSVVENNYVDGNLFSVFAEI